MEEVVAAGGGEQRFWEWMNTNNFQVHPHIAFHHFPDTGRGIIALQDLPAGTQLFVIPRSMLLQASTSASKALNALAVSQQQQQSGSEENSDSESDSEDGESDGTQQMPWTSVILALMYEATNPASKWKPYIDILPTTFTTPLFWDDKEVDTLLGGTTVHSAIGKQQIINDYHEVVLPFIRRNPEEFSEHVHNLDMYLRMGSIVSSYSFNDEEGNIFMVAMADMLNHKTGHNNARLYYAKDHLSMSTIKPVKAGQELFNTYGDLSNGELFRKYGFIDDPNPHNTASISWSAVEQSALETLSNAQQSRGKRAGGKAKKKKRRVDQSKNSSNKQNTLAESLFGEKMAFLTESGLKQESYAVDKRGLPSGELVEVAEILLMPKDEWEQYLAATRQNSDSDVDIDESESDENSEADSDGTETAQKETKRKQSVSGKTSGECKAKTVEKKQQLKSEPQKTAAAKENNKEDEEDEEDLRETSLSSNRRRKKKTSAASSSMHSSRNHQVAAEDEEERILLKCQKIVEEHDNEPLKTTAVHFLLHTLRHTRRTRPEVPKRFRNPPDYARVFRQMGLIQDPKHSAHYHCWQLPPQGSVHRAFLDEIRADARASGRPDDDPTMTARVLPVPNANNPDGAPVKRTTGKRGRPPSSANNVAGTASTKRQRTSIEDVTAVRSRGASKRNVSANPARQQSGSSRKRVRDEDGDYSGDYRPAGTRSVLQNSGGSSSVGSGVTEASSISSNTPGVATVGTSTTNTPATSSVSNSATAVLAGNSNMKLATSPTAEQTDATLSRSRRPQTTPVSPHPIKTGSSGREKRKDRRLMDADSARSLSTSPTTTTGTEIQGIVDRNMNKRKRDTEPVNITIQKPSSGASLTVFAKQPQQQRGTGSTTAGTAALLNKSSVAPVSQTDLPKVRTTGGSTVVPSDVLQSATAPGRVSSSAVLKGSRPSGALKPRHRTPNVETAMTPIATTAATTSTNQQQSSDPSILRRLQRQALGLRQNPRRKEDEVVSTRRRGRRRRDLDSMARSGRTNAAGGEKKPKSGSASSSSYDDSDRDEKDRSTVHRRRHHRRDDGIEQDEVVGEKPDKRGGRGADHKNRRIAGGRESSRKRRRTGDMEEEADEEEAPEKGEKEAKYDRRFAEYFEEDFDDDLDQDDDDEDHDSNVEDDIDDDDIDDEDEEEDADGDWEDDDDDDEFGHRPSKRRRMRREEKGGEQQEANKQSLSESELEEEEVAAEDAESEAESSRPQTANPQNGRSQAGAGRGGQRTNRSKPITNESDSADSDNESSTHSSNNNNNNTTIKSVREAQPRPDGGSGNDRKQEPKQQKRSEKEAEAEAEAAEAEEEEEGPEEGGVDKIEAEMDQMMQEIQAKMEALQKKQKKIKRMKEQLAAASSSSASTTSNTNNNNTTTTKPAALTTSTTTTTTATTTTNGQQPKKKNDNNNRPASTLMHSNNSNKHEE
eukprot:TRINITY_DN1051_c2_g1_i2.p1 TRINITY_DN1051_c2_g1~~TRINITY_DN1051_c2_g1_i2.p1  ORF type:complete len:1452 (+),score=430.42 TRINITY_DN1051_c2_g1_i2:1-4356(+)